MAVKRIKPNILSSDFESSRTFYNDVIGLDGGHGLDWIMFFGTDKREVQLSVMALASKHTNIPTSPSRWTMWTRSTLAPSPLEPRSPTRSPMRTGG